MMKKWQMTYQIFKQCLNFSRTFTIINNLDCTTVCGGVKTYQIIMILFKYWEKEKLNIFLWDDRFAEFQVHNLTKHFIPFLSTITFVLKKAILKKHIKNNT